MLPYRMHTVETTVLIVFFTAILGYALFELRGTIMGPSISIDTKEIVVHDPYTIIEGDAARITVLTINGTVIPVTEAGHFKEPLLLAPGYNVVDIEAMDTARRTTKKRLTIIYEPPTTSKVALPEASTTPTETPYEETGDTHQTTGGVASTSVIH